MRIDRDPVHAGDDFTSHAQRWTFSDDVTLDGILVALVRGYRRANVAGGANWLVQLTTTRGVQPLAVILDDIGLNGRQTLVLQLLPRVAGRRLTTFTDVAPGEPIEVYLRYLVNTRLRSPDELGDSPTVVAPKPRHVVREDDADWT